MVADQRQLFCQLLCGNRRLCTVPRDLVAIQSTTSMAKTAVRAAGSELLKQYPLSYKLGPYVYQAKQNGQTADYSVADGTKSFSTSLQWAFGIRMGQSFLFERNGGIFMAPLTYYPEYGSWDFTVDQPHAVPDSLEKALGRHLRQRGAGMFQLPQYRLYNQRPV